MKKLVLIVLITVMGLNLKAQYMLNKGKAQLNAGFGFSSWGLPVYVGFDYGVHKDVSVGLEASYRSYYDNYGGIKYGHTILGFSGNVNYHFNYLLKIPKEWDLYGGANVGFYIWNNSGNYPGSNASGLGLGLQVGGRYYFNERFGINLEGGGGNAFSGGKLGITYKF